MTSIEGTSFFDEDTRPKVACFGSTAAWRLLKVVAYRTRASGFTCGSIASDRTLTPSCIRTHLIPLRSNHGMLTAGKSIEEATYLAIQFERAARAQILAESMGTIKPITEEAAREAHDFTLKDAIVIGTFNSWAEELLRLQPDIAS